GVPSGVTPSFSQPSCTPGPTCTTILTLTVGAAAVSGTSTITITGNSVNSPNRTTSVTLVVALQRTISIVTGNNQTGVINATLPKPLVVSVSPANPPVTVIWVVTGGARPSATSTPTVNGLAQIALTLGPTPGPVTVGVSISGDGVATSVTFVVNDATSTAV